jgi:hypothetical protein
VTVEFVLILVIMLTILASVSMPAVDDVTNWVEDTSTVVSLAAGQRRIVNTAEEIAMGGCGSYKTVKVYVDPVQITYKNATLLWNRDVVWGEFSDTDLDEKELSRLSYPDYIKLTTLESGSECFVRNNTYFVKIEKDCSATRHDPVGPVPGIGGVCW